MRQIGVVCHESENCVSGEVQQRMAVVTSLAKLVVFESLSRVPSPTLLSTSFAWSVCSFEVLSVSTSYSEDKNIITMRSDVIASQDSINKIASLKNLNSSLARRYQ